MTIRKLTAVAAALVAGTVFAQGDESAADSAAVSSAEESVKKPTVPLLRAADGVAEVLKPGDAEWSAAEEGMFYPLGSSYRVRGDGRIVLSLGPENIVTIEGDSSFSTRPQGLGDKVRTIILGSGTLELDLARNLPEGTVFVTAPGFTVKNPVGKSKYVYETKTDGDEATVRCVTGALAIDGRHFEIVSMNAADEVRIRTIHDNLETFLYGTSGSYVTRIDRGMATKTEVCDDGSVKATAQQSFLDWEMSPETKVRISRMLPAIGERMSVTVMTFDATGELKNNFAFAEGRAEVNSGELVKATKKETEELAKRAAEVTEEASATETEEAGAEDEGSSETTTESTTEE